MKEKIGVLTFHRCINYGSYWQARCLAEGIGSMGHEAVLLDHADTSISLAEWRCALQPTLPTRVPAADVPLYKKKVRRFQQDFMDLPLSDPFPLHDLSQMPACHKVVIGSDEVWNFYHPWYAYEPAFFGEGLNGEQLIAYAASFGNYAADQGIDPAWADKLRQFDCLSVRDRNAQVILQMAGIDAPLVLDPCLQFPAITSAATGSRPLGYDYMLVYGHNFSDGYKQQVKAEARKRGLTLLSVGYRNDWADEQWLDAGPYDFIRCMQHAVSLATNFFHGCVFATFFNLPFLCEVSDYRSIKIAGLLDVLGMPHRMWTGDKAATKNWRQVPGAEVEQRLEQMREQSAQFLGQALDFQQFRYA